MGCPIAAPRPTGLAGHGAIRSHTSRSLLEAPLQPENYKQKFELLLHLEEIQLEVDIRRYDLQEVPMVQNRALLLLNVSGDCCGAEGRGAAPRTRCDASLQVPGVAENRPSVLRGDHLFASLSSERDSSPRVLYKGYVHGVELERVQLGFSPK